MEKSKLEEYIKKLMELNETLDDDEITDDILNNEFVSTLNNVLTSLNKDIENNMVETKNIGSFTLDVKIKKLDPNAIIPTYSKNGDAGLDLTITKIINETKKDITYGFGIAMEIPYGYVGLVFPRSSVRNYNLLLTNCVGVIDSGYRGEIQSTFKKMNTVRTEPIKYGSRNAPLRNDVYSVGDRGAQIIIIPYPTVKFTEVQELSETERNDGGFGSTGS